MDKSNVAKKFAKAHLSYNEQAIVQKIVAEKLVQLIKKNVPRNAFDHMFEIGCGTGNLTQLLEENFQIHRMTLNDLYPEVTQHFDHLNRKQFWIGDIEKIELVENFDLAVSSSALQWLEDLDLVFQKVFHCLEEHHYFCFSSYAENNLHQIKQLTGQGLRYLTLEETQQLLIQNGFELVHCEQEFIDLNFQYPKDILKHLKATGVTATAEQFRWTKRSLTQFYDDYEMFKDPETQLYSLTYHPVYFIVRKP